MAAKILVVDRDRAFAIMLQEMLETEGGYAVQVAHTGSHALALLRQADFDLTIIDVDLDPDDMPYRSLVLRIRQFKPAMRLMLIPLMGRDLPPEVDQLDIQAVLPKPFFADDLLSDIEAALAKQVTAPPETHAAPPPETHAAPPPETPAAPPPETPAAPPPEAPAAPPPEPQPALEARPELQALLTELAREINADAVLLLSTTPRDTRLIAHVSTWDTTRLETLADLCLATVRGAQAAASFLGQPDGPFEHNMFESDSARLYMMAMTGGGLLVAVASASTPLGTIRHNLRRTARHLSETFWT